MPVNKLDRIRELQKRIATVGMKAAVILYSRDLFYYTGTAQTSALLVTPKEYHLFIRWGYDFTMTDGQVWLDKYKVSNESRLETVITKLKEWKVRKGSIGLELDIMPVETYLMWRELLSKFDIVNVSPLILEQRKKKDSDEIALIRQACHVVDAGHKHTLEILKAGMTELELSAAIEAAHRRAGHEGIILLRRPDFFFGAAMVSSGLNLCKDSGIAYSLSGVGLGASVPLGASMKRIKKGEPVVVDKGVFYQGYHADQARTYVVGKANSKIRSLFNGLKDISDYLISNLGDGMKCSEIYGLAWQRAQELELDEYFQGLGIGKSMSLVAHGVGLEANEPPIVGKDNHSTIHNGYVLAIDIHMRHPEYGAVKLEDMVLITDRGAEVLNISPRELFEIEHKPF